MIQLNLKSAGDRTLKVLCLGAHSDDIEIGCGGTILRLSGAVSPTASFTGWCSAPSECAKAKREQAAELFVGSSAYSRAAPEDISRRFHALCRSRSESGLRGTEADVSPDLIFTHNRRDAHQDHRLLSELTWNTFRDHLILEYEIPKYDGDMGRPSVFVPLETQNGSEQKCANIMDAFRIAAHKAMV